MRETPKPSNNLVDSPELDAPPTPTGLYGTPYGRRTIELFWDRSPVPGVDYLVYQDGDQIEGIEQGTSMLIRDLTPATEYSFSVSAINSAGVESKISPAISVTTGGKRSEPQVPDNSIDAGPQTPAGLYGEVYSRSRLEIFWQPTAAHQRGEYTLYRIYINGVLSTEITGTSESFKNLEGEHSFAVASVNERGEESPRSPEITLNTYVTDEAIDESPIDRAMRRAAEFMGAAGATFALKYNDEEVYVDSYGDIFDADSVRPIASLSKPVTAYILQQMAAEGKLSLTDEITLHVPDIAQLENAERLSGLTLFDLLTHHSGLSHLYRHLGPDWLTRLNYVLSQPPAPRPSYANDNYTLLTLAIANNLGSYQKGLDKYINVDGIDSFRIGVYHDIPSFAGVGELEASAKDYFKFMLKSAPTSVEQNGSGYGIAWLHNYTGYLVHSGAHKGVAIGNHNSVAVYKATTQQGNTISFVYLASGTNGSSVPIDTILEGL